MRALIVEDSADRQAVLRRLFAQHEVQLVTTGREAIHAVRTCSFDVVFLDYDLEDEATGADVAEAIARQESLPVVIVHSMNPDGVTAILHVLPGAKPLPFEALRPRGKIYSRLKRLLLGEFLNWDQLLDRWTD